MKIEAILFIGISMTVMLHSCRVDPIIQGDPCITKVMYGGGINGAPGWTGYTPHYDSVMYFAPCFNPNNPDEFVYREWRSSEPVIWLCTYNMITGEKRYLADHASFNPVWCTNDWIVFNRGGSLWKIKSNGDNLTPLFEPYACYEVDADPITSRLAFRAEYEEGKYLIIGDINGLILEKIQNAYFSAASWSPDGEKIAARGADYYSFGFYKDNLSDFDSFYIEDTTMHTSTAVYDSEWYGDSENILWYKNREYFITNITTKQTTLFSTLCYDQFNLWPSVAPDKSGILWERNNEANIDGNQYEVSFKTSIVLTDMDGSNELVILPLPE